MTGSQLYLTNTLTRKKEAFEPKENKKVKLFTCGPSIYRRLHIGNYRTFLYEDVLHRYLEYLGYQVERIINFTDVEDKAIAEAYKRGVTLEELTTPIARQFIREAGLLRIKLPGHIPRSSEQVDQAVHLIKILLEKGYAYRHGKDIFYDPLTFRGFGRLYGLDMSRWPKRKVHFRKDNYAGQRWNLGDFIIWHGCKKRDRDSYCWKTDIGRGRPAWNIQDPAIVTKHLGYRIDISCGGVDNLYRHHDYLIAVIEAITGQEFAHYWLHGEHLLVNGSKMSKSKGNIIYPEDLIGKGYEARHIRFYLIYGHYREKMNFTPEGFREVSRKLDSLREMARNLTGDIPSALPAQSSKTEISTHEELIHDLVSLFESNMNDDLQVKGAFDDLYGKLSELMALKMKRNLSWHDGQKIREALEKADSVFQVIYT